MRGLPDFSDVDRARLKELDVCDAKVEALRYARIRVRMALAELINRNAWAGS